jgi:hypothetical protein
MSLTKHIAFLAVGMVATLLGACSLLEVQPDSDEPMADYDAHVHQAMGTIEQVWEELNSGRGKGGGRIMADSVIDSLEGCGVMVLVDSSEVESGSSGGRVQAFKYPRLIVNYASFSCEVPGSIVREGTVTYQLVEGDHPSEKGSVVKFAFIDFKVTDLKSGLSTTYNGEKFITNLSGGSLRNLGHCFGGWRDVFNACVNSGDKSYVFSEQVDDCPMIQRIRARNFRVTFQDGRESVRNIAKLKVTYKLLLNNYRMFICGDTAVGGQQKVADWGVQPNGKTYYSVNLKPVVFETCFNFCKYTRGVNVRKVVNGRETTTLYGVDKQGKPMHNCLAHGRLTYYFTAEGDSVGTIVPYY